jgi:hypothetical protein
MYPSCRPPYLSRLSIMYMHYVQVLYRHLAPRWASCNTHPQLVAGWVSAIPQGDQAHWLQETDRANAADRPSKNDQKINAWLWFMGRH